ncbi:MAG: T9SS type A sorting domain-containing protein, partial [Chlorobium sp.]|nr:T9SS type A sorting domain-containing protein [Chlorobium sp.]
LNVENENIPQFYELAQNYPNPFNPITRIRYQLPEPAFVTIKVYDVLGNEIESLLRDEKIAGSYEVEFDGSALTSGIYYYRITEGNFSQTKKMILLK